MHNPNLIQVHELQSVDHIPGPFDGIKAEVESAQWALAVRYTKLRSKLEENSLDIPTCRRGKFIQLELLEYPDSLLSLGKNGNLLLPQDTDMHCQPHELPQIMKTDNEYRRIILGDPVSTKLLIMLPFLDTRQWFHATILREFSRRLGIACEFPAHRQHLQNYESCEWQHAFIRMQGGGYYRVNGNSIPPHMEFSNKSLFFGPFSWRDFQEELSSSNHSWREYEIRIL